MNKSKKIIALVLVMLLSVTLLSGCGKSGTSPSGMKEIKIMLFGDMPVDMDKVTDEFIARTKDTLNISPKFTFTPIGDYKNLVALKMSSGEAVDGVFDAQWNGMFDRLKDGSYIDLTSYFHNDEYPGLKAAFSEEYMAVNKFDGKIMGIPFNRAGSGTNIIMIRKDLREKYGAAPVTSIETLEAYMQAIKENEPNMYPLNALGSINGLYTNLLSEIDLDEKIELGIYQNPATFAEAFSGDIYVKDGKLGGMVELAGASEADYQTFPAPYNSNDAFMKKLEKIRSWYEKGYISQDIINQKDAEAPFVAGKAAACATETNRYSKTKIDTETAIPGAEIEFYVLRNNVRELKPGAIPRALQAWNFLCIPVTCKDPDSVMKFMDWMFSSQENHDLFEYGIEGVHWNAIDDVTYSVPADKKTNNYVFPGYELTWTFLWQRFDNDIDPEMLEYMKYMGDPKTTADDPFEGFAFDSTPVENEIKQALAMEAQAGVAILPYFNGMIANPRETILKELEEKRAKNPEYVEICKKIRVEAEKQLKEFLDKK